MSRKLIRREDIGEVFSRLYDSEINFRFENFWDDGYRWSVVGYEGHPEPGEIRWTRIERDDAIHGSGGQYTMIPKEADTDLTTPDFLKKDWLARGHADSLEEGITELCEATIGLFPNSSFAKWCVPMLKDDQQNEEQAAEDDVL